MASKIRVVQLYPSYISSQISSAQNSETQSSIFNLFFSQSVGLLLFLLRHQYGILVPVFISTALVISIILSFIGASVSLLIGILLSQHATIRRFSLRISSTFLASAVSIMACLFFLEIFRQVSSGIKSWKPNEDGGDSFFFYGYVLQVFRKIYPPEEQ
ncbi:hypothetical protein OWV82_007288 [Melia azedarach]|uniref:Uncharacterized protein n=2 Tax=Melia azedarach TaxID=155640 RepID=A0ACC1YMY0_MELAZ|nr:hypothetical protein OWV82_006962 [Melia azedarach]KAJ4723975.1 hypothetical protein OWV82_007288 [Melia azedarach]